MEPTVKQKWGAVLAGAMLAGLMSAALFIPGLPKRARSLDDEDAPPRLYNTANPFYVKDQMAAHKMVKLARNLGEDMSSLEDQYNQLPPFHPPAEPRLREEDLQKYINTYNAFVQERSNFLRYQLGPRPGFFQTVALYGMVNQFYAVVQVRSLVSTRTTREEFDWLLKRIMEAALFCVQYKFDHETLGPDEKKQLEELRENLYLATGIKETVNNDLTVFHPERLQLSAIPRGNIALFLEHYPEINYSHIHFQKPAPIVFNAEAILASAQNNPP